jgi:hypothetical protein
MPKKPPPYATSLVVGARHDIGAHRPAQQMLAGLPGQKGQPIDRRITDLSVDIGQVRPNGVERKPLRRCAKAARDPPQPA